MIIRHLPFFVVAAEEENIQRAADRLGMSQPALSRRIRDLEDQLGLRLFERVSGRVKLTASGAFLGREARRIVYEVDEITKVLRKQSGHGVSRLALGLNERAIALPGVATAIKIFQKDSPGAELTVRIMSSRQQADALKGGEIDLAILYAEPEDRFRLRLILDDDPLVAILSVDHPLSKLATLKLADLAGEELIWLSQTQFPRGHEYLTTIWSANGIKAHISTEVYSTDAALHAVLAGLGVAILRRSSLNGGMSGIVARTVVELAAAPLQLSVAWVERQDSSMQRRFLRLLEARNLIRMDEPSDDIAHRKN